MSRARHAGATLAAVLSAAALAACGAEPASEPPQDATAPSTAKSVTGASTSQQEQPVAVPEELKFKATTLDGGEFSGESLAGKAAVLWFWAPWCPNCKAEAPHVAKAAGEHQGKVTFVGVAANDSPDKMREFVREHKLGFTQLQDENADVWERFGVTYQPAYAFVSPDGKIDVVKEQLPEGELAERIGQLAGA